MKETNTTGDGGAAKPRAKRLSVISAEGETIDVAGAEVERHAPRKGGSQAPHKGRGRDLVPLGELRPGLASRIRHDFPDAAAETMISAAELARYRTLYVQELLEEEHGEVSALDRQVAESIAKHDTIAANIEDEFVGQRTFGEWLSDGVATFGGSWTFLIYFFVAMSIWMGFNLVRGDARAFDPYPFILLNLVLSCIAAVQAPIIMMSQRRQETKDRLRAFNDYRVNLKAELEIHHLHEKLDHLISKQWQRLAEIQQMQLEMMQERNTAERR